MKKTLTLFLGLALTGCGPSEPLVCKGHQDVEFGTGNEVFIPLEDGDPMPIFNGPQGGSHMYASVEACNIEGPLEIQFTIFDDTLEQYISSATYDRSITSTRSCCGAAIGLRGFVSIPSPTTTEDTGYTYTYGYGGIADQLDGHDLTINIIVTDSDDATFNMTRKYIGMDAGTESTSYGGG